jgi:hypothetical protein
MIKDKNSTEIMPDMKSRLIATLIPRNATLNFHSFSRSFEQKLPRELGWVEQARGVGAR